MLQIADLHHDAWLTQVAGKAKRTHLLQTQPFKDTFGQRAQRKRPRLSVETYGDLLTSAQQTDDQCAPRGRLLWFLPNMLCLERMLTAERGVPIRLDSLLARPATHL